MGDSIISGRGRGILENGNTSSADGKTVAKHACSKADCLLNRPYSQWSHIDKKIAKFKAELAEKRLARAMKFYLNLSLRQNFCPGHTTLDPFTAGWFLKRLRNVVADSFQDYFRSPAVLDKVVFVHERESCLNAHSKKQKRIKIRSLSFISMYIQPSMG